MVTREQLQSIEWAGGYAVANTRCPACLGHREKGHFSDCWLSAALRAEAPPREEPLPEDVIERLRADDYMGAIRLVRANHRLALKDAKALVDKFRDKYRPVAAPLAEGERPIPVAPAEMPEEVSPYDASRPIWRKAAPNGQ